MPQVDAVKSKTHKRVKAWSFLLVIVVILLIAGAVALNWYMSLPKAVSVYNQALALDSQSKYAQAQSLLSRDYGKMLTDKDRALIESAMAATASDQGNYSQAIGDYQKLNSLQPNTISTLQNLGDLAFAQGDKSLALSTYKELLPLMQKSRDRGPTTAEYIQDLQSRIAELSP
jgi:tetratricopeptide (TPR) repeat protein